MSMLGDDSFSHGERTVRLVVASREQALRQYLALQRDGYAPWMAEDGDGEYVVGYEKGSRPLVGYWEGLLPCSRRRA